MRRGFTLVEMIVALLLTSIVAMLAQGLLAAVLDGATAVTRAAPSNHGPLLGRIWLREACRGLEVGTEGTKGFEGDGSSARFSARLLTSDGWVERQQVRVETKAHEVRLLARSFSVLVVDSIDDPALDYLVDVTGEGGWVSGWSSPVSAPMAIRLRWTRAGTADTLLCPIGGRG